MVASGSSNDSSARPSENITSCSRLGQVARDAGLHADSRYDDDSQAQHWRPIAFQAICQKALRTSLELVPFRLFPSPPSFWPGHLKHCPNQASLQKCPCCLWTYSLSLGNSRLSSWIEHRKGSNDAHQTLSKMSLNMPKSALKRQAGLKSTRCALHPFMTSRLSCGQPSRSTSCSSEW